MKKALLILAASLATLVPTAATAQVRGRVIVGRPHYYVGGGFYNPFWGSYWGPAYSPYYFSNPNSGEVKLDTKVKDASVFINGAYAGLTKDNKTMHLRPGQYNIEIRGYGHPYSEHVYVVAGKTLHLHPEL
jgi:hypothetical protein